MKLVLSIFLSLMALAGIARAEDRRLILAVGAEGSSEFTEAFNKAADQWQAAAQKGGATVQKVDSREALEKAIKDAETAKPNELWVVLIGHGTFNERAAKFALKGPDISAEEMAALLKPWPNDLVFVNASSASAPFVTALAGPKRIVISATKSGSEVNYSRFGGYLADSLQDVAADLNKDAQVSLLEAFLRASARTAEYFQKERRLVTETAIIDDTGDGKGTRGDWFEGLRVVKSTAAGENVEVDGARARQVHLVPNDLDRQLTLEQRKKRDELETAAEKLRGERAALGDEVYYKRLEEIFVEIAKIYDQVRDT